MHSKHPNPLQYRVLTAIVQGLDCTGFLPRTQELAKKLYVTYSSVSMAKASLRKHGYLDDNGKPSSLGIDLIQTHRDIVPLQIPFMGKVKAGRVKSDDIVIDMRDITEILDAEMVTIPNIVNAQPLIVVQVDGISMVEERIYPNDYVIVSLFDKGNTPAHGDLVVVKYIPYEPFTESYSETQFSEEMYEGPTLKYYYEENGYFRLSTRKSHRENPHTIKASAVRAIGKVIGTYRYLT